MNELYEMIEERIKSSGYTGDVNGRDFYYDISAQADEKEDGTYMFIIKKTETLFYKGCMTIMEKEFDLHFVDIVDGENSYHVDFDV